MITDVLACDEVGWAVDKEGAITAKLFEIPAMLGVPGLFIKPFKTLACKMQSFRFSRGSKYCHARENCVGETVGAFAFLQRSSSPIEATEPAARVPVPEHAPQIRIAMLHSFPQSLILWVNLAPFGGKPRVPRLKLQELLIPAARSPATVEVAEEASIFAV